MELFEFTDKYENEHVDVDGIYGAQCVDLIKKYTIDVFGIRLGTFGGSAKTGWYNKSNTFNMDQWQKIDNNFNNPDQIPEPGDIIFWGYGTYGHVAIVTEAFKGENKLEVFNQNTGDANGYGYDDRCRYETTNYNKCLGWYRYKGETELEKLKKENKELKEIINNINKLSKI